jgi:hypothetical protein
MLIGALIIGLVTAYYFGLQRGMYAAGASAALFLIAAVVPGASLVAYAVVGVGVAGVCLVGPRFQKPGHRTRVWLLVRGLAARVRRLLK